MRLEIIRRLEASGAADRLLSGQRRLLTSLINDRRIKRMAENAAMDPASAYLPSEMLTELREGIWSELAGEQFEFELYRRNLQRAYIEILTDQIDKKDASTDLPALSRGQLVGLLQRILRRGGSAGDSITWMHLADLRARIQQALDPKPKTETKALDASGRRR